MWVLASWNLWSKEDRIIDRKDKCKIIWPDGFLSEILILLPSVAFLLPLWGSWTQSIDCHGGGMTHWKSEVSYCLLSVKN